jgi:low affinity Fe/Cu permease
MIEQVMNGIATGVGSPWMIPLGLIGIGFFFAAAGVDIANIAISIFTFLLLPILQHSQNRDGAAIQLKLDEMIKATDSARNELIGADKRTQAEIEELRDD